MKRIFNMKIPIMLFVLIVAPMLLAGSCRNRGGTKANLTESPSAGEAKNTGAIDREETEKKPTEPVMKKNQETEGMMSKTYDITLEEKKWLMQLAKDAVHAAANGKTFDPPDPPTQLLKDNGAAFVTLKKAGQLRGCIGHIIAHVPLCECVASVARSAALEDPRFSPVTSSEVDSLHFEISVLTPPEDVKDPQEIVVGKDGVIIKYGGIHQGVFLPQVPTEQGWNLTEYLDHLCYKAGVMKKGCWKDPQASLKKFQAVVWEEEDVK